MNLLTTYVIESVSGTNVGKTLNRALIDSCFNRLSVADGTRMSERERVCSVPQINDQAGLTWKLIDRMQLSVQ